MGNQSSGSSNSSSINASLAAPHGDSSEGHSGFFWPLFSSSGSLDAVMSRCHAEGGGAGWLAAPLVLLLTAVPANGALMWLLLRGRRALTPSEVLGLNVSVMGVLCGARLPLDVYAALRDAPETLRRVRGALFALSVFGLPLLLTCMCLERCLAAARPVAYLRLGRRGNRVALCAAVWTLTLAVAALRYLVDALAMALPLSAAISLLFLVMLLCLLQVCWVLRRRGPGEASASGVPRRRRALRNLLAVMVPAVVAYSPLVALVPFLAVTFADHAGAVGPERCGVLQLLLLFPNVGQFIGPAFYLSRLRQLSCCSAGEPNSRTQAEQLQS